jgi:hypothetical protein
LALENIQLAVNMARNLTPDQDGIAEIISRADHTPARPPPSVPTRQSAHKKNAPVKPGFVPTQADSQKSLQVQLAANTGVTDGRTSLIASVNKCSTSAPRSQVGPPFFVPISFGDKAWIFFILSRRIKGQIRLKKKKSMLTRNPFTISNKTATRKTQRLPAAH